MSNLSFISKLIEKVVSAQLKDHIKTEGLVNVHQSAYRCFHSTETTLLEIKNDISVSLDGGRAIAVTLLDLSAAFDTIDHATLYSCLENWFGLMMLCLIGYLTNRKQKIRILNTMSEAFALPYGVPQGSVLGPLLFTLYTSPLSSVISKFNVTHHFYADDTQIYIGLDTEQCDTDLTELSNCLDVVDLEKLCLS